MYWIKHLLIAAIVIAVSSGCSHRIQRKAYFQKHDNRHQLNSFNPAFADKSKKVKLDDEGIKTGKQPTDNISDELPDASSKHPTMRSYTVNGKRYYPSVVEIGTEYKGMASWYGPDFNGKKTSNGEIYDMYAFTAAHKTLPMHTIVRVTNLDNRKQVTVRINDRGPFMKNRIIDLSKAAARTISMTDKGTAPVRLEVLGFQSDEEKVERPAIAQDHYQPKKEARQLGNFYVQIGSFKQFDGAKRYQERYTEVGESNHAAIIKEYEVNGDTVYRVLLAGFRSDGEARNFISENRGFKNAFIIRD